MVFSKPRICADWRKFTRFRGKKDARPDYDKVLWSRTLDRKICGYKILLEVP